MIGRVRGRAEFARLGRSGRRSQADSLWCNWCLNTDVTHPKLAFAVSRAYGPAVRRNRLRRRVRHVLVELDRAEPLPAVTMLFGPRKRRQTTIENSTEQTFEPTYRQVHKDVTVIMSEIRRQVADGSTCSE